MKSVCQLRLRPGLETLEPYEPGKPVEEVERELGIASAIKLASNEHALGVSPVVKSALRRALKQVYRYPDAACYALRQSLTRHLHVKPEEIILGNGSNELLMLLGRAYLSPADEVLTSQMSFVVYTMVAKCMNARLVATPMQEYTYDLEVMQQAITSRTKLIFIANPNNPTGTAVDPKALHRFVEGVPEHCLIVLDEAYYEYLDQDKRPDALVWVKQRKNMAVLRTFSKAYALAGLRLGYGVVSPEVKQALDRIRDPFNVNSLAQIAAQAALQDRAHFRRGIALIRQERQRMTRALQQCGLYVLPSQTNFLFIRLPVGEGRIIAEKLLSLGIIVRPFPGPHLRITLGQPWENNKMLRTMQKVLGRKA